MTTTLFSAQLVSAFVSLLPCLFFNFSANLESARLGEETFQRICESISESSSLEGLSLSDVLVREEHMEEAVEHVANCIANSATLKTFDFDTWNIYYG